MATQAERLAIVETKVDNIEEKVGEIKHDVKDMHDCLDRTRDDIMQQLTAMHKSSCEQHDQLAAKLGVLEKEKARLMLYGVVALAFAAGAGWMGHLSVPQLLKFVGL